MRVYKPEALTTGNIRSMILRAAYRGVRAVAMQDPRWQRQEQEMLACRLAHMGLCQAMQKGREQEPRGGAADVVAA